MSLFTCTKCTYMRIAGDRRISSSYSYPARLFGPIRKPLKSSLLKVVYSRKFFASAKRKTPWTMPLLRADTLVVILQKEVILRLWDDRSEWEAIKKEPDAVRNNMLVRFL